MPEIILKNVTKRFGKFVAVDNLNAEGKIKLNGMEWTARSTDGKKIPVGTLVKVDRIEGVKAIVSVASTEVTV